MQFNPLQSEETNTGKESKNKSTNSIVTPLTMRQVEQLLASKEAVQTAGKIEVIGRIVRLKEMLGRTLVTISDETGIGNIIEVQNADQLQEEQYYQFIANVKMDKEEPVLMSYQSQKITDYNRIQFHFANVMFSQAAPPIQ